MVLNLWQHGFLRPKWYGLSLCIFYKLYNIAYILYCMHKYKHKVVNVKYYKVFMKQSSLCCCLCFMSSGWLASKAKHWLDGAQSPFTTISFSDLFPCNKTYIRLNSAFKPILLLCLGFDRLSKVLIQTWEYSLLINYID